ncbi:MAG: hypothetical protein J7M26_06280, partial [Armatimonadetes bacterium]|nr:hypothetical protein [Armatimonadota bacterium]
MGLSREDAVRELHRASRENGGQRIVDRVDIPVGAQVDFLGVDGTKNGKPAVRYLGSGRALAAWSSEGLAFWRIFERAAKKHGWKKALRAMKDLRRRGIVVAPAWFGAGARAAETAAKTASAGTAALLMKLRVAVILAEFPEWRDRAPQGDGDGVRGSSGDVYYELEQPAIVDRRHVQGNTSAAIDWYIDSPGGRMPATGGEPLGTVAQWNTLHPARTPDSLDGPTTPKAQDYWYRHIFDVNFAGGTGVGGSAWPGSLRNYYWDNSHGNIALQGGPTDVFGWVRSHHILDRRGYPRGPTAEYMIQPGTPLIRPTSEIQASDGVGAREILRASLTQDKLTILYAHEFLGSPPPMPQLFAYQQDVDGSTSGDQNG